MTDNTGENDGFCDQNSVERVLHRINQISHNSNKLAFLVLSGSFNPVHTQHIRALILTRKYLEYLEWTVIGGFLSPSSDHHVLGKLQVESFPLMRRIELCNIAIEGFDWLNVCVKGEFSSNRACRGIHNELQYHCFKVLGDRQLTGVEIMGSDVVVRIFDKVLNENSSKEKVMSWQNRIICCLLRPGPDSITHRNHIH